jgi:hypothetical protein
MVPHDHGAPLHIIFSRTMKKPPWQRRDRRRWRRRDTLTDTSRYVLAIVVPIVTLHIYSTIRTTEQQLVYGRRRRHNNTIDAAWIDSAEEEKAKIAGSTAPHAHHWALNETLRLRFDWTSLKPLSPLAIAIDRLQSNCRLPPANFWFRNRFGLGSDLHVYSQALCNALEAGIHRVATVSEWIWVDQHACGGATTTNTTASAATTGATIMQCYFPSAEPTCPAPTHTDNNVIHNVHNLTRGRGRISNECPTLTQQHGIPAVRAASTEFLFTRIAPAVQNEALRQLQFVFQGQDNVPSGLITVHVRWGDKGDEMALVPIASYVDAVRRILLQQQQLQDRTFPPDPVCILLATEDPEAVKAFREAAPVDWTIYVDHYFHEMLPHRRPTYNGSPIMSKDLHGRPGLVALGSLLVSMEANAFVLTTNSNWSRLMNEIRKNIIDPRCGNCTMMIDLSPGEW